MFGFWFFNFKIAVGDFLLFCSLRCRDIICDSLLSPLDGCPLSNPAGSVQDGRHASARKNALQLLRPPLAVDRTRRFESKFPPLSPFLTRLRRPWIHPRRRRQFKLPLPAAMLVNKSQQMRVVVRSTAIAYILMGVAGVKVRVSTHVTIKVSGWNIRERTILVTRRDLV